VSLRNVPHTVAPQSTNDPPDVVGIDYAVDVIKRERQLILVVRECVASYTVTCIIENERSETLRDALITLCVGMRPFNGPPTVIRTDSASGFACLVNDELLSRYRMSIELGRVKISNKTPVAETAVQELEGEIAHQPLQGGAITHVILAVAPANRCQCPMTSS